MAGITTASATGALNEKEYINKIYDQAAAGQKDALQEGYDQTTQQLTQSAQAGQQQTQDYLQRTYVEAEREKDRYSAGGAAGAGAKAQAALSQGNQRQANVTALQDQQTAADQEFERRRQLLGQQYAAAIRQAQADNDKGRAEALYQAAKEEEAQLRGLREQGAALTAKKGDYSIYDQIAAEAPVTPSQGASWAGVTANEDSIHAIYDAQLESQRAAAEAERATAMSQLEAQQKQAARATDEALTDAYVGSLKQGRNYRETQTAHGQNTGTAAQAEIARRNDMTGELTRLRTLGQAQTAQTGAQQADIAQQYAQAIANARAAGDTQRLQALYEAAEREEQYRIEDQKFVGEHLADRGDWSVLGKLYGLTEEQIAKLSPGSVRSAYLPPEAPDTGRVKDAYEKYRAGVSAGYGAEATLEALTEEGYTQTEITAALKQYEEKVSKPLSGTQSVGRETK